MGINILLITVLSIPWPSDSAYGLFPAALCRHKHYGSEDFIVSNILPLAPVVYLLFYAQKRMKYWKFHSGSKQRGDGLKFPAKDSFYMILYPAVGRSRDLSEGYYDMFRPQNDYFCDLDADRTGLSWIYRIYFSSGKNRKNHKNWYRQVLFHTVDICTFLFISFLKAVCQNTLPVQ